MSATRDAILDAAYDCVLAGGFRSLSLDALAGEAGVSRSTLYRLFGGGREEVLNSFVSRELGRFFLDLHAHVGDIADIEELIVEGLWYARRHIMNHPVLNVALAEDSAVLDDAFDAVSTDLIDVVAQVVAAHLPSGPLRDPRSRYIARMALSFMSAPGTWDFSDRRQVATLVACEMAPRSTARGQFRPPRVPLGQEYPLETVQQRVTQALIDAYCERVPLTMDAIAHRASLSRATVYRQFPGGRPSIIETAIQIETGRLVASLALMTARARSVDEALLSVLCALGDAAATNRALGALKARQPHLVRNHLRFDKAQRHFTLLSAQIAPLLSQWVDHRSAQRLVDWMVRIVASYWLDPSDDLDVGSSASLARFYNDHVAGGVADLMNAPMAAASVL